MKDSGHQKTIIILGPTASGKTELAAHLASQCNGEIISIDSRQVYRKMNIGTGKDYSSYIVEQQQIPYHLIDIREPGYEYNIYEFLKDFSLSYQEIVNRGNQPILCGGSGLYLDALLKGYQLQEALKDSGFEKEIESRSDDELREMIAGMKKLHNTTDLTDRKRMIRAIRIASAGDNEMSLSQFHPVPNPLIIGIMLERDEIRNRITSRLKNRLSEGMIEEVEELLNSGLTPAELKFYGLEYKYITLYLTGEIHFDEMFRVLNTAIHQFAKRQMTWFRKIEREGDKIYWINGTLSIKDKVGEVKKIIKKYNWEI